MEVFWASTVTESALPLTSVDAIAVDEAAPRPIVSATMAAAQGCGLDPGLTSIVSLFILEHPRSEEV